MPTESDSFVRAQTSHKGEAATWSDYSWIRAYSGHVQISDAGRTAVGMSRVRTRKCCQLKSLALSGKQSRPLRNFVHFHALRL